MSALISLNYLNGGLAAPVTGAVLTFPEPRSWFTVSLLGGISPAGNSGNPWTFQAVLEGTNDGSYSGSTFTVNAAAQWQTILGPAGNVMTTFGIWETKKLATVFNSYTGGSIFPNLGCRFAAVRLRMALVALNGGTLTLSGSIAASGTEAY